MILVGVPSCTLSTSSESRHYHPLGVGLLSILPQQIPYYSIPGQTHAHTHTSIKAHSYEKVAAQNNSNCLFNFTPYQDTLHSGSRVNMALTNHFIPDMVIPFSDLDATVCSLSDIFFFLSFFLIIFFSHLEENGLFMIDTLISLLIFFLFFPCQSLSKLLDVLKAVRHLCFSCMNKDIIKDSSVIFLVPSIISLVHCSPSFQ